MKCNRCDFDGEGFQLVDESLGMHMCPECGSADVDGGSP